MVYLPDVLRFLGALGITAHIDLEDQVVIEYERGLTVYDVCNEIGKYHEAIRSALILRARYERHRFYGGPMDGKPHRLGCCRSFGYRVGRAKWAAYSILKDGRAIFKGYATSEAKAKAMAHLARVEMET